jgi:alpha-tubulin suppressor-like RCC1 family protein
VAAISIGQTFAMALKRNGTVVAWGRNELGQTAVPSDLSGVISISAGCDYALALKSDGSIVTWGNTNRIPALQNQVGFPPVVAIEAAVSYALVARTNNGLYPLDDCNTAGGLSGRGGGGHQWYKPIPWSTPVPWATPPSATVPSAAPTTPSKWTLPQRWN